MTRISKKIASQQIFLYWYRLRIENYIERTNLPPERAIQQIKALPSFKERNAHVDSIVDEPYRLHNRPDLITKNQIAQ
jgi:hypothetical protein